MINRVSLEEFSPCFSTENGSVYQADCMEFLTRVPANSIDLVFADPPFNIGKEYTSGINDRRSSEEYLAWCYEWLSECVRVLRPGGSLFVWNLPKWNLHLGNFLSGELTFRHWISVAFRSSFPIKGRLYPAHYSLLYYSKGAAPRYFLPDRLPIEACRSCGESIKDYGGYKRKLNPSGISLSDVWTDISPVRHSKYKFRSANALPLKLLDRVISMASGEGSVVLDPFCGSGTTLVVAEILNRIWLGSDLDCSVVPFRFQVLEQERKYIHEIHQKKNTLWPESESGLEVE